MQYPKELATAVQQASRSYPLEGFVPGQGPLQPKLMIVGKPLDEPKSRILLLLADKQERIDEIVGFSRFDPWGCLHHQRCPQPPILRQRTDQQAQRCPWDRPSNRTPTKKKSCYTHRCWLRVVRCRSACHCNCWQYRTAAIIRQRLLYQRSPWRSDPFQNTRKQSNKRWLSMVGKNIWSCRCIIPLRSLQSNVDSANRSRLARVKKYSLTNTSRRITTSPPSPTANTLESSAHGGDFRLFLQRDTDLIETVDQFVFPGSIDCKEMLLPGNGHTLPWQVNADFSEAGSEAILWRTVKGSSMGSSPFLVAFI